jgi:ubiquinone/menaquinone biosynthesis C-methylase UbiE
MAVSVRHCGPAFEEIVRKDPNDTNTGIDLSAGMLARAIKRLKKNSLSNYNLSVGTAFKIDLVDASIDTLINNYMFDLMTFDDMDKILQEFKRVLRDGGKLILVNMTEGERFGSRLYDWLYRLSPETMGGCRGVKLAERLKKHGFDVDVREYYLQLFFPSEVIGLINAKTPNWADCGIR